MIEFLHPIERKIYIPVKIYTKSSGYIFVSKYPVTNKDYNLFYKGLLHRSVFTVDKNPKLGGILEGHDKSRFKHDFFNKRHFF